MTDSPGPSNPTAVRYTHTLRMWYGDIHWLMMALNKISPTGAWQNCLGSAWEAVPPTGSVVCGRAWSQTCPTEFQGKCVEGFPYPPFKLFEVNCGSQIGNGQFPEIISQFQILKCFGQFDKNLMNLASAEHVCISYLPVSHLVP